MKRFAVLAVAGVVAFGFSGNVQAAEVDSDITIESGIETGIETEDLSAWPRIRDSMLGRDRDKDRRPPPPPPPPGPRPGPHPRYDDPRRRPPPPPPPPPPRRW